MSSIYFPINYISRSEKKIRKRNKKKEKEKKKKHCLLHQPQVQRVNHEVLFVLFSPNCHTSKKQAFNMPSVIQRAHQRPAGPAQRGASRCGDTHSFPADGLGGAACVSTVGPLCRIQEVGLLYLWQISSSHGFQSSQLNGRLCGSGPGWAPTVLSPCPSAPGSPHLTVAFLIPVT